MIFKSLWQMLYPRRCIICGKRISEDDGLICLSCNMDLPRTNLCHDVYDNDMARLFWGKIPVERAAALFYYSPDTLTSRAVKAFKYFGRRDVAEYFGRMVAEEFASADFFDGIDLIIPLPLAPGRLKERGYNQCSYIAKGISSVTGLPIDESVVERISFSGSQTRKHAWERMTNVGGAFRLMDASKISGKQILLVDDVVTTGATISSCGAEIAKAGDVRISVLTLAFTKSL
jgi:ComF family protein